MSIGVFFFHKGSYVVKFGPVIRLINDMGEKFKLWGILDAGIE